MSLSIVWVMGLAMMMAGVHCRPEPRGDTTHSFAGSNLYFLHALPQAEQEAYVARLAEWGVKVIRLWGRSILSINMMLVMTVASSNIYRCGLFER
jgi:hypothetical protein